MTKSVELRLDELENRNKKVDADKAWEKSVVRRSLIAFVTYVFVGTYLMLLDVKRPWLNAVVPVMGFLLSTMGVQKIKEIWLKERR